MPTSVNELSRLINCFDHTRFTSFNYYISVLTHTVRACTIFFLIHLIYIQLGGNIIVVKSNKVVLPFELIMFT